MSTLFGEQDKLSIEIIREFCPKEGYYLACSFGKDSIVLKHLTERSGVAFTSHFACTGIEPPELYKYGRKHHPDVIWHKPERPFLQELAERGLPNPMGAWCCGYLKEGLGEGFILTGVRRMESTRRARRKVTEFFKHKSIINPLVDWTNDDVWEYIHKHNLPYCELYDRGWKRIGCLMCPKASLKNRLREMREYPKLARAIKRAGYKAWLYKVKNSQKLIGNGTFREYWHWWFMGPEPKDTGCELFE